MGSRAIVWGAEFLVAVVMKVRRRVALETRCPFCLDACGLWSSVCEVCQARQHADCWREHGACAACRSARPRRRSHSGLVVAALAMMTLGFIEGVERYKSSIPVTIISGRCAMDEGMGPQYWAAPRST